MKYERVTKSKRNEAIVKLRQIDTRLTLEDIAKMFKITKQRVHQIIKRANNA